MTAYAKLLRREIDGKRRADRLRTTSENSPTGARREEKGVPCLKLSLNGNENKQEMRKNREQGIGNREQRAGNSE
jgi:hypothetical protein